MSKTKWTYMLRIKGRNKTRVPMERLGEYIRDFALLLGSENKPIFKGIQDASIGLRAEVPVTRTPHVHLRLVKAKSNPESREGKALARVQNTLDEDKVEEAEILDSSNNILYTFHGTPANDETVHRVMQAGVVDGLVTGIKGVDDTMHLFVRDHLDRDMTLLIKDENLAREILKYYRSSILRFNVDGAWIRSDSGWIPEVSRCTIIAFDVLDGTPISEIFDTLRNIEGNGWARIAKPMDLWKDIRGIEH
jgi:hypothetical protein